VLKKLEEQLKNKKVDPELLKRMNWTEEDARRFIEKVRGAQASQANPDKPFDPLNQSERDQFGQGSGLKSRSGRRAGTTSQDTKQEMFQDQRVAPPPEYRDRYDAFNKSLSTKPAVTSDRPNPSSPSSGPPAKQ
jgi:hypothetical protein